MSVSIVGLAALNKSLSNYSKRFEKETVRAVNVTANNVRNNAIRSIKQHSAGETYEKYRPRRTHTASAPGGAPNTDTGRLINSITVDKSNTVKPTAEVIAGAEYATWLEFGTTNMEARPFMFPALEKERPEYEKRIREIPKKALK